MSGIKITDSSPQPSNGLCHIEQPTHRPSGRMCAECVNALERCNHLPFHAMQPIGKPDADGTQRVRCTGYIKAAAR